MYEAGSNSFTLSPSKWIEATNAKGVVLRQGQNSGTFAHSLAADRYQCPAYKTRPGPGLLQLNLVAITQMKSLIESKAIKRLK
ncbi:hypothetical protein ACTJIJ_17165 [Niabella sp. 22666]|uniref:hypothetical protein n=1 Tax=Niabella sp. 22666 TaxID=3453954 RepID=UPI003F829F79